MAMTTTDTKAPDVLTDEVLAKIEQRQKDDKRCGAVKTGIPCDLVPALLSEARAAGEMRKALRLAFPHFQNGEDVTPSQIKIIGEEWTDMVMASGPSEIEFCDQNGDTRKIFYDEGDWENGIRSGWVIPEDADWEATALRNSKGE